MLTCVNLLARLGLAWLGSTWLASLCWLSLCWLSSLQFPWKKSKKSKKKCSEIASTKSRTLCRGRIMRVPSDGTLKTSNFLSRFWTWFCSLCLVVNNSSLTSQQQNKWIGLKLNWTDLTLMKLKPVNQGEKIVGKCEKMQFLCSF